MCRWIVFIARSPVVIKKVLIDVENSIVHQSFRAGWHPGFTGRNNATLNADGLGVGWYQFAAQEDASLGDRAFYYKSIEPAWSDLNLTEIASCVKSPVMFAHVRAASMGSIVSKENCHPFRFGRLLFMHNGHIEDFHKIKRKMIGLMTEEAFLSLKGVTDTEHAFALLVSNLTNASREEPFSAEELESAMTKAMGQILSLVQEANITTGFTTLNFALTDGVTMITTRYCDKFPQIPPPSLYFCYERFESLVEALSKNKGSDGPGDGSEETKREETQKKTDWEAQSRSSDWQERWKINDAAIADASKDPAERALLVSSEPTTKSPKVTWYPLPANSMLIHTRGTGLTDHTARPKIKHIEFDAASQVLKRRKVEKEHPDVYEAGTPVHLRDGLS